MSKLSVIRDLIDIIDRAESALGNARRAFPEDGPEWNILHTQFKVVGSAKNTIEERILPRVESEAVNKLGRKEEIEK